jgi:hypothetical protein
VVVERRAGTRGPVPITYEYRHRSTGNQWCIRCGRTPSRRYRMGRPVKSNDLTSDQWLCDGFPVPFLYEPTRPDGCPRMWASPSCADCPWPRDGSA